MLNQPTSDVVVHRTDVSLAFRQCVSLPWKCSLNADDAFILAWCGRVNSECPFGLHPHQECMFVALRFQCQSISRFSVGSTTVANVVTDISELMCTAECQRHIWVMDVGIISSSSEPLGLTICGCTHQRPTLALAEQQLRWKTTHQYRRPCATTPLVNECPSIATTPNPPASLSVS